MAKAKPSPNARKYLKYWKDEFEEYGVKLTASGISFPDAERGPVMEWLNDLADTVDLKDPNVNGSVVGLSKEQSKQLSYELYDRSKGLEAERLAIRKAIKSKPKRKSKSKNKGVKAKSTKSSSFSSKARGAYQAARKRVISIFY